MIYKLLMALLIFTLLIILGMTLVMIRLIIADAFIEGGQDHERRNHKKNNKP